MASYVMDPISSFTDKRAGIVATALYADATSWVIDIRGQNDKIIIVKNTGAAALTYNILASIDDELDGALEWDLVHLGDTVVAPAGMSVQKFSDYYTYLKVQVQGVGGVATIKAAATGN